LAEVVGRMATKVQQPVEPSAGERQTKFERKREAILDAAGALINEYGLGGTTLQEVAAAVGLNTTSVTYYFRRKEQLAVAVFARSLERLQAMVDEAADQPDPQQRVLTFIRLNVDRRARVLAETDRPLVSLSDIRSLDPEVRAPLDRQYTDMFRDVRSLFGDAASAELKELHAARAHVLLEIVFWLPAWLTRYSIGDFDRVTQRLFAILSEGLAPAGTRWEPTLLDPRKVAAAMAELDPAAESFLRAATVLINERGYRGASVERIAEQLNVTKGSFYHHLDAKDDLVMECFRQSYKRIAYVQYLAHRDAPNQWVSLSGAIATLLDTQFDAQWPLTRTTALQALPADLRIDVVRRSDRTALRFMGTLVDGVREGTINPVDPLIASQLIVSTLNSAFDLHRWADRLPRERAIAYYASTLVDGLFNDRVLEEQV